MPRTIAAVRDRLLLDGSTTPRSFAAPPPPCAADDPARSRRSAMPAAESCIIDPPIQFWRLHADRPIAPCALHHLCAREWVRESRHSLRGSVVGVGFNNFSVDPTVAFLWARKDGIQVIPLLPGDASSGVAGINEHSLVVGGGLTTRASTCQHPWVWSPEWATPSLLPTLTGLHPEANCPNGLLTLTGNVNEKGEIAGQSAAADGSLRAVRWKTIKRGSNR